MKRIAKILSIAAIFTVSIATLSSAAEEAPRTLKVTDATKKLEVRHSQIGYRNTLLFYTFAEQKAVLRVMIDNKDKTFPISATCYLFSDDVTPRGLGMWLNNQHSDGIYPEVPEPVRTVKLPAMVCKVTGNKLIDQTDDFGGFDNYAVTFEVRDFGGEGVKINAFKGETKVHVKTQ